MKKVKLIAFSVILIAILSMSTGVFGQYAGASWGTSYQLVNVGSQPANIIVSYYDQAGAAVAAASKSFSSVAMNDSVLVIQKRDDPNLPAGKFSAVISSDQPLVSIVNIEGYPTGSNSPVPPFASYSGSSKGSTDVFLPSVMHNYYGFYTEMYIQNTGTVSTNISIEFSPGKDDLGNVMGSTVTKNYTNVLPGASLYVSQENMTELGAASGTYAGKFLGMAKIVSTSQAVYAVVNQHNVSMYRLLSYNGFDKGATNLAIPVVMRGYYGYYTAVNIANIDPTNKACVRLTYIPDATKSVRVGGLPPANVVVNHVIGPKNTLLRFDGASNSDKSDLNDAINYSTFFGSMKIESIADGVNCSTVTPVVAILNMESVLSGDGQAGSINAIDTSTATHTVIAPVIMADFWGYYTALTVQNLESTQASCNFTYTSDKVKSDVKGQSRVIPHTIEGNSNILVYEGRKGLVAKGDINTDAFWQAPTGRKFIGSLEISCDKNVVAFVNEEVDIPNKDSMYSYNAFSK